MILAAAYLAFFLTYKNQTILKVICGEHDRVFYSRVKFHEKMTYSSGRKQDKIATSENLKSNFYV